MTFGSFTRKGNKMKGNIYLLQYAWKFQKKYIIYSIMFELISSIAPFASIIMPKFIIDEFMGNRDWRMIFFLISVIAVSNLMTTTVCSWMRNYCFILKGKLYVDFQEMITTRIAKCDYEKLEDPSFLDTKEKAKKFIYANGQGFGEVMDQTFHIIGNVITFAGIVLVIGRLNILVVFFLVFIVAVNAVAEGKFKEQCVDFDMQKAPIERRTNYLISVIEDFSYGKEIRLLNASEWFAEKVKYYLSISQDFYKKQMCTLVKGQYVAGVTNMVQELSVYLILAVNVMQGAVSIGDFTMYISAINQFSNSLNNLMKNIVNIRLFEGYYDALRNYLDVPVTMNTGNQNLPEEPYIIEFKNVSFKYPGQDKWVLKNVNMKLEGNQKYSIVGENGAGKTTFIKLLCRLYDPVEGEILINGINIKEIEYDDYLGLFSTVFQDYKLFSFTIRDNITFGKSDDGKSIEDVLKKSGINQMIGKMQNGLDTYIHKNFEEDGFEPSGGEGQKLALARALYQNRPIVILDEPAAALDAKAEYFMYKNFNELVQGKLTLYISHRMSSARFCNKILVFENGKITESGTHAELMEKGGTYQTLYKMQAHFYQD